MCIPLFLELACSEQHHTHTTRKTHISAFDLNCLFSNMHLDTWPKTVSEWYTWFQVALDYTLQGLNALSSMVWSDATPGSVRPLSIMMIFFFRIILSSKLIINYPNWEQSFTYSSQVSAANRRIKKAYLFNNFLIVDAQCLFKINGTSLRKK